MSETEEQFSQPLHWIDGEANAFKTLHAEMTLRDWFAGQALAGMLARADLLNDAVAVARGVYQLADAMLEARTFRAGEPA